MRTLPKNKSENHKLIINATYDYFGIMDAKQKVRANQIAIYLMGRKRGVNLTEEEKSIALIVRDNLRDEVYVKSFV